MTDAKRHPKGDLIIRTQTMPADTNQNGDIFGGWLMSQMDLGGGMLATEIARGRIATVAVEGMTFHQPVKVGDVVCVYGDCTRIGKTSMTIKLEVWIKPLLRSGNTERYCVTEAVFTYVAIDDAGRPRPVPKD
ncbi:acyl-CoA thioester hydrolase YciA [Gallaecimonas xiamenensis]|uniref:Thioesterase superfamily protein n=1 Tax=Gallaecimonas xiamenensis 3-C-1 TaxID=745411 RepID=K2J7B1_9GAMM|nr:acyl-CoA thioester hydrolase YciA [Gallaecimonas xiamenensis]EKE70993.1 thioesterase superfamily protein [Gallaecimonas xiamenensis 3-C-1]